MGDVVPIHPHDPMEDVVSVWDQHGKRIWPPPKRRPIPEDLQDVVDPSAVFREDD